ncbi:MAG TPA: GumC family protein [Patescibacteria group bacterium]|nr:GumC family protein [Patescibacteria group bacterium]
MQDKRIELRDLYEVIKRRRKIIYYSVAILVFIALVVNVTSSPVYESGASFRIKNGGPNEMVGTGTTERGSVISQVSTYSQILQSRAVIEAVVESLYPDVDKNIGYGSLIRRIRVTPVKDSDILNVKVQGRTPEEAQAITNVLAKVFNDRVTELARAQGKEARVFIGERLDEAKRNLDNIEKDLVEYKKSKQAASVSDHSKMVLDRQGTMKKMSVDSQVAMSAASGKLANINAQIARLNPGYVGDSPLIQQYRSKLAEQEAELAGLRSTFTDSHPKVISLLASINENKTKLNAEVAKVVNAEAPSNNPVYQGLIQGRLQAENEVSVAQSQLAAIKRAEAATEMEMKSLPEKEQGLVRLIRDYTVAEEAYTGLAKRFDQARIDEVMQPTNVQIVDTGDLPLVPVRPRPVLNIIVALLLGLCGGCLLAFTVDYFHKTIDSGDDVKRYLGVRLIGVIPTYDKQDKQENTEKVGKLKPAWVRLASIFSTRG